MRRPLGTVLIAGASGVIGRPLVEALCAGGRHVTGTAGSTSGMAAIRALGAEAVAMDGRDADHVGRSSGPRAPLWWSSTR